MSSQACQKAKAKAQLLSMKSVPQPLGIEEKTSLGGDVHIDTKIQRRCRKSFARNSKMEGFSQVHMHLQNEAQHDVSCVHAQTPYPCYISGVMNHVMMPSTQIYHESRQHVHNHANSAMLPQYGHMPQFPEMYEVSSYPFYQIAMCL